MKLASLSLIVFCTLTSTVSAGPKNHIEWSEPQLTIAGFPGSGQVVESTLTVPGDSEELQLWLTPELSPYVNFLPEESFNVNESGHSSIAILVDIPVGAAIGKYEGTLHVRAGKRTLPEPLKITIVVSEPTVHDLADSAPSLDRLRPSTAQDGSFYVEDEILVGFDQEVLPPERALIFARVNGLEISEVGAINIFRIRIPDAEQLEESITVLLSDPHVLFAVRHWYSPPDIIPNDPNWSGFPLPDRAWAQKYIRLPEAWEFTTGSGDGRVAIVDSGFDIWHNDLRDNLLNPTGDSVSLADLRWSSRVDHGTNVAGVVGATANNNLGLAGVIWDADTSVYPASKPSVCLFLDPCKLSTADSIDAMTSAIASGARVINYSAGSLHVDAATARIAAAPFEQLVKANPNVLFVVAAGNNARSVFLKSPANLAFDYPNVIAVAAVDQTGILATFSNRGPGVTVAAPGVDIWTSEKRSDLTLESGYIYKNGTSFSAPFVAGLAGLLLSADGSQTASQLKEAIVAGAIRGKRKVPGEDYYVINAEESIAQLDPAIVPIYFEGTVNSIDASGENPPNIRVGDKIQGTYELNLDIPEAGQTSSDPNFGLYLESVADVEIDVGPYRFFNPRPDELSVRDNDSDSRGTFDLYGIYMFRNVEPNIGDWVPGTFVLQLFDPTASAFSSDQIPDVVPSPVDFVSENTLLRMPFYDDVGGGYFIVDATLDIHRANTPAGRFELQPITGDWANSQTGNRITQIFTGASGVPTSLTVFAREWSGIPFDSNVSEYAIDTFIVCDAIEDILGDTSSCYVNRDVGGPIGAHEVDRVEGRFLTYEFPASLSVELRSDQFFLFSIGRQTVDTPILDAGGSNSNPIPYSRPLGSPLPANPDFDNYFAIETQ